MTQREAKRINRELAEIKLVTLVKIATLEKENRDLRNQLSELLAKEMRP